MNKLRVRWDEVNLQENEANKPVRKRITEPKTPYYRPMMKEDGSLSPAIDSVESMGYAEHAEALRNALKEIVSSQNFNTKKGGCTSFEEGTVKDSHGLDFSDQRRVHYDEFKKVKELEQKGFGFLDEEKDGISDEKENVI